MRKHIDSELFEDFDCIIEEEELGKEYQEVYDINIKIRVKAYDADTALDIVTDEVDYFFNKLKKNTTKSKKIQVEDYEIDAEIAELE